MKIILFYILTLVTGGQFAFPWIFMMISQIRKTDGTFFRGLHRSILGFFVLYVAYLTSVLYLIFRFMRGHDLSFGAVEFLLLFIGLGLAFYACWIVFKIANFVRFKRVNIPGNLSLFFLFLFYASALPLLQAKLNVALNDN